MNFKRLFLAIGLTVATGGAALFCLNNGPASKPVVEAKAEASPANTTIYLEVCSSWMQAGAVPRLYVSPSASSWVKPSATIKNATETQNALYSFNLPTGTTSFFIYRMNPDNPDSAAGEWNGTQSINYSSSYNYYNVTNLNSFDCPYTSGWMNVFQRYYSNHQEFRLTIINEDYNWFDANASTWIRFWDGTEIRFDKIIAYYGSAVYTNSLKCSTELTPSGGAAIYATGFNIFRKSSDGSETWSQTGNWAFTNDTGGNNIQDGAQRACGAACLRTG